MNNDSISTFASDNSIRRLNNIDALKAICAFCVVFIHTPFPVMVREYIIAMMRFAVPVFFMITGYLYPSVVQRRRQVKQIKKILKLFLISNAIYCAWYCFIAIKGHDIGEFTSTFTLKKLYVFAIFNASPWKGHLWYLGAILYVLIIIFLADKFSFQSILYYSIPVLIACTLMFGKYSLLILGREFLGYHTRNFLFAGLLYFCVGRLIQGGMGSRIKTTSLLCMIVLFSATSIMEHYILVSADIYTTGDYYISTTFLAAAIFLFALRVNAKGGVLSKIGCKYSTWLYILHYMFSDALSLVTRAVGLYDNYQYIAPFAVYAATLVFLIILSSIRNKLKEASSYGKQI